MRNIFLKKGFNKNFASSDDLTQGICYAQNDEGRFRVLRWVYEDSKSDLGREKVYWRDYLSIDITQHPVFIDEDY